jgi:mono/diheme cytochrome c family protein
MKKLTVLAALLAVWVSGWVNSSQLHGAVTPEQRKQISAVSKETAKAAELINKKEFDEAAKLLNEAEQKLKQIAKEADIKETDKLIAGPLKKITSTRERLEGKRPAGTGGAGGGAFERDVAPVLAARCLGCHGANNPRANLRIDTFAGIVQGGDSGAFVVPGKPEESSLVARITASGDQRMPKNGAALSDDQIKKISDWVAAGAKYTGSNTTPLGQLKAPGDATAAADAVPVKINKPTGSEKVSFTNDIAPFMVNLCLNCHSGNNPRGGYSIETFEKLMRGGKSGRVVLPGNTTDSRMWHLVGLQDPIKMPQGQARITPTNHANLKTWIEEGAKFDGPDAKATLRSLVPTDAEKRAKELASLNPEELAKRRLARAEQLWKAASPNEAPTIEETDAFIIVGNVGEARNKEIAEWAGAAAARLIKLFRIKEPQIWRGKLVVFVFKERFSYAEFAKTNENRDIPSETREHARVTAAGDEAYVCMLDSGDGESESSPGAKTQLSGLLAEGLLQSRPNPVPEWAAKGTGLMLAAQADAKNPYFRGLASAAYESLKSLNKPEELFEDGTFSPADLPAIGYTLATFMLKRGGESHFVNFLSLLAQGKKLPEALGVVYNADVPTLAQAYLAHVESLPGAKGAAKKKRQ